MTTPNQTFSRRPARPGSVPHPASLSAGGVAVNLDRMKWIRYNQELPQRWAFKRDIPKPWQHWAVKVRFLFEAVWIVRDNEGRVYMPDGEWAQAFDFYLRTPGHVIGLRDLTTANAHDWAEEWRAAMHDRIQERFELGKPR